MLNQVKKDLHAMINGVLAQQLRERGQRYRIIYGVELPRLEAYAEELRTEVADHQARHDLALALWQTETRECRLLAPMLMPAYLFSPDEADEWAFQSRTQEEASCLVRYLLAALPYASDKAFQWMAAEQNEVRLCGLLLIARLMRDGGVLTPRDEAEFMDQADAALGENDFTLRKAAYNALLCLAEKGLRQQRLTDSLLARHGI